MQPAIAGISERKKSMIGSFLLVIGYCLCLFLLQLFLCRIGLAKSAPSNASLGQWDAGIYESIATDGYQYPLHDSTGWYILFPWVWRLLHASRFGISIVNVIFFAAGFAIIADEYVVSIKDKMLWLSTPSLFFMMVPYTESLFFLLVALSFYGIIKQNRWIIWISLFLLALTRATATFLIPAFFMMELLTNSKRNIGIALKSFLINYTIPSLLGLAVFVLLQYYDTGEWFAYYKYQYNHMGHEFSIPILPFSDFYGENRVTWLNGLAVLPCLIALLLLVKKSWKWLFKNEYGNNKVYIMTLAYLPVTLFFMIFFNPKWGSGTTNLLGLHRYTLCTPFIFIFLYHTIGAKFRHRWTMFVTIFFICNIVWLSMGSYVHIQQWLFYNFLTLLTFGYMLHDHEKAPWATYAIVAVNVFFQVMLFQQFLQGLFVD